jgi:hypothetical protein
VRRMVRTYQILFLGGANLSSNNIRFIYLGAVGLNKPNREKLLVAKHK